MNEAMALRDVRKAIVDYYGANLPAWLLGFIDSKIDAVQRAPIARTPETCPHCGHVAGSSYCEPHRKKDPPTVPALGCLCKLGCSVNGECPIHGDRT